MRRQCGLLSNFFEHLLYYLWDVIDLLASVCDIVDENFISATVLILYLYYQCQYRELFVTMITFTVFINPLPGEVGSISIFLSVCLTVCLSVRLHVSKHHIPKPYEIFWPWYIRPWLGPPLATMQYVMYFRFMDDVMFSHNGANIKIQAAAIGELILHHDSPDGDGGKVCCRWLFCLTQKFLLCVFRCFTLRFMVLVASKHILFIYWYFERFW